MKAFVLFIMFIFLTFDKTTSTLFLNKLLNITTTTTTTQQSTSTIIPFVSTGAKIRSCKSTDDCHDQEVCYKVIGYCICAQCKYIFNCQCNVANFSIDIVNRVSFKRAYNQTHSTSYFFKTYDLTSAYTFGLGFGLPIVLVFLIIAIFIYCLRKKYSLSTLGLHPTTSTTITRTTTIGILNNTTCNRSNFMLNGNHVLSFSPSFLIQNHHHQINSIFDNNLASSQLNAASDTESTISSSFFDDGQQSNYNIGDDYSISNKPPIYEDISNFSEIDKLPTYESFRRFSKTNVLL
jgi:hypothetical protein